MLMVLVRRVARMIFTGDLNAKTIALKSAAMEAGARWLMVLVPATQAYSVKIVTQNAQGGAKKIIVTPALVNANAEMDSGDRYARIMALIARVNVTFFA